VGAPFYFICKNPPPLEADFGIILLPQFSGGGFYMAMKLPSVMSHDFASVPGPQVQRSSFDVRMVIRLRSTAVTLFPFLWMRYYPAIL